MRAARDRFPLPAWYSYILQKANIDVTSQINQMRALVEPNHIVLCNDHTTPSAKQTVVWISWRWRRYASASTASCGSAGGGGCGGGCAAGVAASCFCYPKQQTKFDRPYCLYVWMQMLQNVMDNPLAQHTVHCIALRSIECPHTQLFITSCEAAHIDDVITFTLFCREHQCCFTASFSTGDALIVVV